MNISNAVQTVNDAAAEIKRLREVNATMLKALEGVMHHNRGTKLGYQLPESLMRVVRDAAQKAQGEL